MSSFLRGFFRSETASQGWMANRGRYAADFITPDKSTAITVIRNVCRLNETDCVVIIVCSAVGNYEQRQAIRNTWGGKSEKKNLRILFLVGLSSDTSLNERTRYESLEYGDMIIENFIDSYYNLTLKSIVLLKWVKLNCLTARYIMKVDDDVYLNVDNLFTLLKSELSITENVFLGKLYTNEGPDRRKDSKWYVPEEVYPNEMYPQFLCGVGYLMSIDVAIRLYEESFKHELFFIEDVFITGICADLIGMKRRNHLGFHFYEHPVMVECNAIHPYMVLLSHYVDSKNIRRIHNEIAECKKRQKNLI